VCVSVCECVCVCGVYIYIYASNVSPLRENEIIFKPSILRLSECHWTQKSP
jgi:hypothetical protein